MPDSVEDGSNNDSRTLFWYYRTDTWTELSCEVNHFDYKNVCSAVLKQLKGSHASNDVD